ncbi:protein adenylyltransferase SelO [Jiella pacifica]|uniref:Protein nucleotidyltransferase YdiU n=1 Tax=Jiella pacifica TaxID=2696469 RepID=A0A6N9T7X4_9HYPH|nr:YdiU family protein [Jiella pacifica]NDW07321.1 YdiU family protein [Jiella pacifica]
MTHQLPFDNSYAHLPERFYARVAPASVRAPRLIQVNAELARHLGIDPQWLSSPAGVKMLAGRQVPEAAEPIAMAYAGHQFGQFVPQLGDGRAVLLGEIIDRDGTRRDLQLKGSGRTPFSRGGDGRAALGPVLREYVVSEAMAALGIPTTRSLAAVATGEEVARERMLPGAVLARVASSHVRVGTFQFLAARRDVDGVRILANYVIQRHYPEVARTDRPYVELLNRVVARQAELVAKWLLVGFIHGVMNTDNVSIAGETIDYGPCAFMDGYDPATVFSSIDRQGRYAYGRQPGIAHWNLTRLAETLLPLIADNQEEAVLQAEEALAAFETHFEAAYHGGLLWKIGLSGLLAEDVALVGDLLKTMADNRADFTLTFRRLCDAAAGPEGDEGVRALFDDPAAYEQWAVRWRQRLQAEPQDAVARRSAMRTVNPAFIPRNHRIEAVIDAAVERDDLGPFDELVAVLARPYEDHPEFARYASPPEPHERVSQMFCGT